MEEAHDKAQEAEQTAAPQQKEPAPQEATQPAEETQESSEPAAAEEQESPEETHDEIDDMTTVNERTIALLSYIGFFAIVPFFLKKDSKFCRFHGKQGMLYAVMFFMAKPLAILDFFDDLVMILQIIVFVSMGFAALSGQWKEGPFYKKACQLEKALILKSETQSAEKSSSQSEILNS
jgi:uncharacterized membrane protein